MLTLDKVFMISKSINLNSLWTVFESRFGLSTRSVGHVMFWFVRGNSPAVQTKVRLNKFIHFKNVLTYLCFIFCERFQLRTSAYGSAGRDGN